MMKLTMIAAAALAAGMALSTSPRGLPRPSPAEVPASVDQAEVDRAVERHLAVLLREKLKDLQEERAWAMGLR